MSEKSTAELFQETLNQMNRRDLERKVLIKDFSKRLREKLKSAEVQQSIPMLVGVLESLVEQVATLYLEVQELRHLRSLNIEQERNALNKLDAVLEKYL